MSFSRTWCRSHRSQCGLTTSADGSEESKITCIDPKGLDALYRCGMRPYLMGSTTKKKQVYLIRRKKRGWETLVRLRILLAASVRCSHTGGPIGKEWCRRVPTSFTVVMPSFLGGIVWDGDVTRALMERSKYTRTFCTFGQLWYLSVGLHHRYITFFIAIEFNAAHHRKSDWLILAAVSLPWARVPDICVVVLLALWPRCSHEPNRCIPLLLKR